jgi:dienelactone hydrolase
LAHVVLFHSILGLRPVEHQIAAEFERHGHTVTLPDLFDGRTADDYDAGFALRKQFDTPTLMMRAKAAMGDAPETAVLSGVSFGASFIDMFWDARPKMAGVLVFAGTVSWMEPRRRGLPVSAHIARPDPFDDEDYFADWAAEAGVVALDLHRYDGVGHYFLDRTLPDYGAAQAQQCLDRSVAFLNGL